jgi:hypothetical protein
LPDEQRERYAVARFDSVRQAEAYLPDNYHVAQTSFLPDDKVDVLIAGTDKAGWTLDEYVIPRLASGGIFAREYPTYHEASEKCAAAMN